MTDSPGEVLKYGNFAMRIIILGPPLISVPHLVYSYSVEVSISVLFLDIRHISDSSHVSPLYACHGISMEVITATVS